MWFNLIIAVILGCIIYADFKYRMVSAVLFAILIVAFAWQRLEVLYMEDFLFLFGINLGYLIVLFGCCFLVMYMKYHRSNVIYNSIGWGDILLLIAFAMWFDLLWFIVFNIISFLIAIVIHLTFHKKSFYSQRTTIPLAGIQSFCFLFVLVYMWLDQ